MNWFNKEYDISTYLKITNTLKSGSSLGRTKYIYNAFQCHCIENNSNKLKIRKLVKSQFSWEPNDLNVAGQICYYNIILRLCRLQSLRTCNWLINWCLLNTNMCSEDEWQYVKVVIYCAVTNYTFIIFQYIVVFALTRLRSCVLHKYFCVY